MEDATDRHTPGTPELMNAEITGTLDRTRYIGGSDIGAILGVNPYKTALDVYREKIGEAEPFEGNQHTRRGTRLEQIAAEEFEQQVGLKLWRVNKSFAHPSYPFLGGHIDRRVVGYNGIAEIKCPSLGSFAKIKREGVRKDYIAQMQWYLGLSNREFGEWIIFCADQWEVLHFRVEFDQLLFEQMVTKAITFWQGNVLAKIPPTLTEGEAAMQIEAIGNTTVRREDPAFVEAMQMLREAKQLAAEAELIEETAKARVKELVENKPGCYVGPGYRLHLTQIAGRSTFDKKALAGAKPLDRLKVGAVLQPLFMKSAVFSSEMERAIETIGRDCNLDLTQFEKQGAPYVTLKPYFVGGDV